MTSDREQISGFPETRRYGGAEGRDYSRDRKCLEKMDIDCGLVVS